MRKTVKRTIQQLITIGCGFLLIACGGGGDGGDGPTVPSGYTGSQNQAVVTPQNAQAIVLEAYEGGGMGGNLAIVPMAADSDATGPRMLRIVDALAEAAKATGLGMPQVRPAATETFPENGTCGGTATYTVTADDAGTSFSGTVVFASYCEDGVTMNGKMSFSGSVNQSAQVIKMTLSTDALTVVVDGETVTISGSVSLALSEADNSGTVSTKLVLTDAAKKTYYLDYTFSVTVAANYEQFTISGRFYAHDYGYVELTTPQAVRADSTDLHPSSGVLRVAGANGTWATLTFLPNSSYRIDCSDGTVISGVFQ